MRAAQAAQHFRRLEVQEQEKQLRFDPDDVFDQNFDVMEMVPSAR